MSKRTYEEYIKNGCNPVGYNEPSQSYYFGQVSVDWLLDQIDQLKHQLAEKDKEIEKLKTKQKPIGMHSKEDYFQRCNFLEEENIKLQFAQKQLALQELEKVKKYNAQLVFSNCLIDKFIAQQIKELKGE